MKKATLCYIRRCSPAGGREYLMLYRNKKENDPNEGKWIGVGGHFEPKETPDECLLREVREETGITLTDYHFCGVIHFVSDIWEDEDMYLYRANVGAADEAGATAADEAGTEVVADKVETDSAASAEVACDEGELRWIPEGQLMDLPMWEGDRLFLKPLMEDADEIRMTLRYEGDTLVKCDVIKK